MGLGTALFGGGGRLFTGGSGGLGRSQTLPCSTGEGRLSTAQETPSQHAPSGRYRGADPITKHRKLAQKMWNKGKSTQDCEGDQGRSSEDLKGRKSRGKRRRRSR